MLRKSFLTVTSSSLIRRDRCVVDIICRSVSSRNTHLDSNKTKDTNIKKLKNEIEKIKLQIVERNSETQNLIEHLSDTLNLESIRICSNMFTKRSGYDRNLLYLIDNRVAAEFVSLIIDDLSKNTCFVAELNPGVGMLTRELLKAGIPLIHLYEEKKEFDSILADLSNVYPGKLDRRRYNLLKINILLYLDKIASKDEMSKIFQGVQAKRWEDTCMQVIGTTSTMRFIRHIIHSLLFRNSFMTYGRTIFYMAIPPSMWHKYTCDNMQNTMYTTIKVLFQLMFDYKLMGKVERNSFLPWPKRRKKNRKWPITKTLDEMDYNEMFVVKIEPKINIYSLLSQKDWIIFWYFVRHIMRKRTNRVIPEIEKWVPDSGARLIARCNHTIFTEFGDLTPQEFLRLFKEFQSWPEYKTSSFLDSMKDSLSTFDDPAILQLSVEDNNM